MYPPNGGLTFSVVPLLDQVVGSVRRPLLVLMGAVLLVLSIWREGLNTIASWVGVTGYPPAVLFAVATLFIILVLLHYSTVISRLTDENVDLAQRIALLEEKLSRPQPPGD